MMSNTREKTVSLPLSEAGKKTILTKFSADSYYNWMLSVLMPFDLLYTYFFRYFRVAYNDMINAPDPTHPITTNNGPAIEYMMAHPDVGGAVTLSFVSIAALSSYWEVGRQEKIKNSTSAKYVFDQLKAVLDEQEAEAQQLAMQQAFANEEEQKVEPLLSPIAARIYTLNHTHDIYEYIKLSFEADEHLRRKYTNIEFIADELKVKLNTDNPQPVHHDPERVILRETAQINDGTEVAEDNSITPRNANRQTIPPVIAEEPGSFQKFIQGGKTFFQNVFINKFLYPVWQSAVLMSFVFWIEWIAAGVFTGNFYPWAVTGLPNVVAYGLPVLAGLLYPAIKIYNYINNYPVENTLEPTAAEKEAAEKDMSILLRRALARREFVIEKEALEKKLAGYQRNVAARIGNGNANGNGHANGHQHNPRPNNTAQISQLDKEILSLRGGQWAKPLLMLFSVATGSYVGAQYCTWIITGLANLLLGSAVKTAILGVAGWPLIIGPLLFGCYKAYETYQSVVDQHSKIENLPRQDEFAQLENQLAEHQKRLVTLGNPSPLKKTTVDHLEAQFFADVSRRGPSKWTNLNKVGARLFQFINGGCTGIFLARVFFVEGSAISLPFAALALSYPVTLAVLAGIGTVYGVIKACEYHYARKDAHAKNLLATRTERLEYLQNEVALADLREQVCTAENQQRAAAENGVEPRSVNSVNVAPRSSWRLGLFDCFGHNDQVMPDDEAEITARNGAAINRAAVA